MNIRDMTDKELQRNMMKLALQDFIGTLREAQASFVGSEDSQISINRLRKIAMARKALQEMRLP